VFPVCSWLTICHIIGTNGKAINPGCDAVDNKLRDKTTGQLRNSISDSM
jgi:hypothetical protein